MGFFRIFKKRALVCEGTSSLQLVCPYCEEVQTTSNGGDVIIDPPDYKRCEKSNCKKEFKVAAWFF